MLQQIVIVDDHDSDLLYGRIVIDRAGIAQRVTEFESARDALAFLQQADGRSAELILLDINMPGLDGFGFLEAFESLRESGSADAAVVMLSSSADPGDRERALAFACVRDYVVKPLTIETAQRLARQLASDGGRH